MFIILLVFTTTLFVINSEQIYYTFPEKFMFGASTSAYQTEGAWNIDGKGPNIWDEFFHNQPNRTQDLKNADDTAKSYYYYGEDIKALQFMGMHFYRFSISWSRLMPTGLSNDINKKGIEYYNKLIDSLLDMDILPVVTMHHFDTPNYLLRLGGWTNEALIKYFEEYATVLFENFGDRVRWWSTFNEPSFTALGYETDDFAPGANATGIGSYLVAHNILKAHARVYHLYNNTYRKEQKGKISITLCSPWISPLNKSSSEDIDAAERYIQFTTGWFAQPIYGKEGNYPQIMIDRVASLSKESGFLSSRLPSFTQEEIEYIRGTADFFSINEYSAKLATPAKLRNENSYDNDIGVSTIIPTSWPTSTTSSWDAIVPISIRDIMDWIKGKYGEQLQFFITENGFSDGGQLNDTTRITYLATYMIEVLKAMYIDNCEVIGYTVWSLTDNLEWKSGYKEKFGLFHVNFSDPMRRRTPKSSAYFMRDVIETRQIPHEFYKEDANLTKLENV